LSELTDKQRQELHSDLIQLCEELTAAITASADIATAVTPDSAIGRLSRQDAMQQQQMALEEQRRNQARLGKVKLAMATIDNDDYGWCIDCGEAIAFERLKIKPESTLCISCQSKREA